MSDKDDAHSARLVRLKTGETEVYWTEDRRKIRLFFGPYAAKDPNAGNQLVGRQGFCVDLEAGRFKAGLRNWYPTLGGADLLVFQLRAKDEIDIAREAFGLSTTNTPDPNGDKNGRQNLGEDHPARADPDD